MFILIDLIIWAVLCTVFVAYERGIAAFVATLAGCVALWFSGINVFMYAYQNPMVVAQGLVAWMVVGFVWATVKFIIKLRKAQGRYVADKATYMLPGGEYTEERWIDRVKSSHGGGPSV